MEHSIHCLPTRPRGLSAMKEDPVDRFAIKKKQQQNRLSTAVHLLGRYICIIQFLLYIS